jgi:hypothetical protein
MRNAPRNAGINVDGVRTHTWHATPLGDKVDWPPRRHSVIMRVT